MKIGIINAYDARNRGDLAIVLCQIELLRRKFQNAEFLVFSHHAETNSGILDRPGVQSVESAVHVPPRGGALAKLLNPLRDVLLLWLGRRSGKLEKFYSCDIYALCGGGYLYSSHFPVLSRNLACICVEILYAIRTGKPVIQFPQSFGPINKALDLWLVHKVCRALPRLAPRTNVALDQLKVWGFADKASVTPDAVLVMRRLLPGLYQPPAGRSGLGVAPVDYRFAMKLTPEAHDKLITDLGEVCRYYHQQTRELIHLFTQVCLPGDDDSIMVDELGAHLTQLGVPHLKIAKNLDLAAYVSAVSSMRAFIGLRMHACIFAFTARVPVIGLAYQPKFKGLYRTLQREDWCRSLDDWPVEWACQILDEILNPGSDLPRQVAARMDNLESQLDKYLDGLVPDAVLLEQTPRAIPAARTA